MTDWKPTKLRDFFIHFDSENPNHLKAADLLQQHALTVMEDNAEWVKTFRGQLELPGFSRKSAAIIAKFEGFRSTPYKCPAGVWTIGYGATYYPNGTLVGPYDKAITREQGLAYLNNHVDNVIVPILARTVPTWGILNDNQKAAIISFAFNLGSNFYGRSDFNTISKALSSKENLKNTPAALMLYVNPGSSFEEGLRRRRKAEGDLFNGIELSTR